MLSVMNFGRTLFFSSKLEPEPDFQTGSGQLRLDNTAADLTPYYDISNPLSEHKFACDLCIRYLHI